MILPLHEIYSQTVAKNGGKSGSFHSKFVCSFDAGVIISGFSGGITMRRQGIAIVLTLAVLCLGKLCFAQQRIVGFLGGARSAYARGIDHLHHGEYREARTVLETVIRTGSSDADLYELLALSCIGLGDIDGALENYAKAIQQGSRRISVYSNRGAVYAKRCDWIHAIADYNQALKIDPKKAECYYNRAHAYNRLRQYNKARADLERAFELGCENPTASALAILLATCPDPTVRNGRLAVEYARKACDQSAVEEYTSLSRLAAAHAEAGQWDEAVRRSEQALKLAAGESRRFERRCLELYRFHEPYRDFPPELVSERCPTTAGEALLYAIVNNGIGKPDEALANLRKAIELNPRLAEAHYGVAAILFTKHTDEAVTHLSRCLELDPKYSDALCMRANANLRLGKYREALADAESALALDPRDTDARSVRLWALADCGEVDRSLQELNDLIQKHSDGAWAHGLRGHCFLIQGRLNDAVIELGQAIQHYPSDVLAYADRAVALSGLGKMAAAKRDLENCAHLAPSMRVLTEARMKVASERRKK